MPTDPIPPQYDPYSGPPGDVLWSQATVPQGGAYGYVPQQSPPKRTGKIIGIALLLMLLAGGAGYGAYVYTTKPGAVNAGTTTGAPTSSAGQPTTPANFDPHTVQVGDCLVNAGTADEPKLKVVGCDTAKSYKVVRVRSGVDIPEGAGASSTPPQPASRFAKASPIRRGTATRMLSATAMTSSSV